MIITMIAEWSLQMKTIQKWHERVLNMEMVFYTQVPLIHDLMGRKKNWNFYKGGR